MNQIDIQSLDHQRVHPEKIQADYYFFSHDNAVNTFVYYLPVNILIVNRTRQVVFANESCKTHLELESIEKIIGERPGEALNCVNAYLQSGGCGSAEGCTVCGAFKAIVGSLSRNEKTSEETRIRVKRGFGEKTLEYRIDTIPLTYNNDVYALLILQDISVQNSKRMMERIFFHDILNYSSALVNGFDIIEENPLGNFDLISLLKNSTSMLFNEIYSQKMLMLAENGELVVNKKEFAISDVVESAVRFLSMDSICTNKEILILTNENISCFSDQGIFKRVLINMLKNALEATLPDGNVTIAYFLKNERVIVAVKNSVLMSHEVQLQIFQKSFSTKGNGRGLGTFSIKLLTEHYLGGTVHFVSSEEIGTVFTIEFPIK
ncbi:MAG: HAMP domain-containing histidine kinase [Fibrobacter sp.]|nr:HAMP domain-containing histidine kinase [Fibrobacter sp.]